MYVCIHIYVYTHIYIYIWAEHGNHDYSNCINY